MERNNRPLGREKQVINGTAHVGRREGEPSGGGQRSGGGGGGLMKLIILAAVALLGGGGGLFAMNGGGGGQTAAQPPQAVVQPAQPIQTAQTEKLDTSVSKEARPKRVKLKGNGKDTTTIMLYMCGTDLESGGGYATKDLQEMLNADMGENVNMLVFTGGCRQWKNNVISSSKNQIYQISRGDLTLLGEANTLAPMTDPATLTQFLVWGKENFPADRYELIFWDHGGGSVSGYGYDEVYPKSGSMDLAGIDQALGDAGVTFDFIGFDACLMATLETALVCEQYADYLIASEETEPGCGWYYTDWLDALGEDPSLSALEIGKCICDSFVTTCGQVARGQQATLSVVDLAELKGTVPDAFRDFALATGEAIKTEDYQSVATARGKTKEFAQSNKIDQVDLVHLASNLGTPESKALAAALKGAVKYNATSGNIRNANGVSIYFPYGRTSNVNKMATINDKIGLDASYTDCIKAFASVETAGQTVAGGSANQMSSLFGALMGGGAPQSGSAQLDAQAVAELMQLLLGNRSVTGGAAPSKAQPFLDSDLLENRAVIDYLTAHQFDESALKWTKKGGQDVLVLSEDQWDLVQDVELNVFVEDGDGYIDLGLDNVFDFNADGDLIGEYDGTWLSVNGQIVAYYMLENEGTREDYTILGRIPALLNGRRVELVVSFTDEVPGGEILGADPDYDEEKETATLSRGLIEIRDGDRIDFICDFYDYDRNYEDAYYLGDPLTVKGPLTLGNIRMDNTDYIAVYRITDIYQNHYWTPAM